jgi:toxin ParE1/3/4
LRVVWSPTAIERIDEEARYIAQDNREAALRWIEGLFAFVERLQAFPESGRVVTEIGRPEYREIIYKSHRVIYRIEKNVVAVLTVRRARQQLRRSEVLS